MAEFTSRDILQLRLINLHLARPELDDPRLLVEHLGAVQAQDVGAAKWAVGQRLKRATEATLDRAFADGAILRTHVLRPTWHFVSPRDIRWMLTLTAARIKAAMAFYTRAIGLVDEATFARCNEVIAGALQGGRHLTRPELGEALAAADVPIQDSQRLGQVVLRAELDGVVCSGRPRGKQQTYALLEERVPPAPALDRDEALARLTRRYFTSHGPATLRDFAWWSGLTVADAKRGVAINGPELIQRSVDRQEYWLAASATTPETNTSDAYLLPNYDEYTVAYKGRDLFWDGPPANTRGRRLEVPFGNVIVVDGRVVGMWSRKADADCTHISTEYFGEVSSRGRADVERQVERLALFLRGGR